MASFVGFRRPKTLSEKKLFYIVKDIECFEAGVRVRAKRQPWNIPDAWCDKPRSDIGDRSWKRARATQYRPVDCL